MVHRYLYAPICIVFIAALLSVSHMAAAAEIPLHAKDASGFGSEGFPSSFVVPYALGERQNTDNLTLFDADNQPVPAQFSVLSRYWHLDNSIRWLRVFYQPDIAPYTGPETGISEYTIRDLPNTTAPAHPVTVTTGASGYTIGNGLIHLDISTAPFSIVTPAGNLTAELMDRKGAVQASFDRGDIEFEIETQGPLVTTIKASAPTLYRGPYVDDQGQDLENEPHDILHGWALRVSVFANHAYVKVDFQLQNAAKNIVYSGPLYFNSMNLVVDGNGPGTSQSVRSVICDGSTPTDYDTDAKLMTPTVSGAIQYFHETWPNGLKTDSEGNFIVEFWPEWSAQYLNTFQGAAGVTPAIQAKFSDTGLYWLEDMQHTVKTVLLHFGSPTNQEMAALAAQLDWQPATVLPAAYYDQTRATLDMGGAVPEFKPPVQDHTRRGYHINWEEKKDPQSRLYSFGWDNFGLDVERKFAPAMAGGYPYYPARFVATGEPLAFYKLLQFARGELNIRPQWMSGYKYAQDAQMLALNQGPYFGFQWRKLNPQTQFAFDYLPDSWQDVKPRDDQHGWFSHVALAYALTGDPWIKDWYEFIGEFRKSKLDRTDAYPDQSHRGIGHAVNHALDAYKATGDAELATLFDQYKTLYLMPARHPDNGILYFPYSAESAAAFQLGYLGRAFINLYHEFPSLQTDMRDLIKDMVDWNFDQCNFCTFLSLDDPVTVRNSHGWTGMAFADIQAWYAMASVPPDVDLINHIHRFDLDGISGNTPQASVCDGQPGTEDGSTWPGEYLTRHTQLAYVYSTYQTVVEPEPLLTNYLDTSLSDLSSITAPTGGIPGTTTLASSAFVSDETGQTGVRPAQGQTIQFPVSDQTEKSLTLDKGSLGLRFKPDTDHDAHDQPLQRFFYMGNTASPPYVTAWLQGQMIHFQVRESWETVAYAKGPWHGGLWQAGQWTDIKFTWDTHTPDDALAIFVNNQRVDTTPQPGGWDVSPLIDANLFIVTDYGGNQPLSGVAADVKAGAD